MIRSCAKCGGEVFRMNRRKRKPLAHAVCPRRKRKRGTPKRKPCMLRHEAERNAAYLDGYVDGRSRITNDGREILFGVDWRQRVETMALRDDGMCRGGEFVEGHPKHHIGVGDPHHIKARWPKRDDRLKNLANVCREVHQLLDRRRVGGSKRSAAA